MIRRLPPKSWPAPIAAIALVAMLTSGCSTVTDNDVAVEYGGHELSVDDFQTLAGDLVEADAIGEFVGYDARGVLTRWVTTGMLTDALADDGITVDDAGREAATAELSASPTWADNDPFTQQFLVDELATQNAVSVDVEPIPDDELQSLYEAGVASSGLLCMRVIGTQDADQTQEVVDRLAAGDDFATIADELLDPSIDPSTVPAGGIYVDPATGSECISAPQNIVPEFEGSAIGDVVGPIDAGGGQALFIIQRPFDEVAGELRSIADSVTATQATQARPAKVQELIAVIAPDADISIDSRYGMWDPLTATVVASR